MNFYVGRAGPEEGVITFCHILDTKKSQNFGKGTCWWIVSFC